MTVLQSCSGKVDIMPVRRNRWEKAFTLIELLCVVALLGLMMAVAVPVFKDIGQKRNLEIAARTLATDMRRCHQAAITTGRAHYIEFLIYYDVYHYRIGDGTNSKTKKVKFPEGISYRSTTIAEKNGIPRLTFQVDGAPINAGTVVLRNTDGNVLYIIVTPATSRVRISDKPPDHWDIHALPERVDRF